MFEAYPIPTLYPDYPTASLHPRQFLLCIPTLYELTLYCPTLYIPCTTLISKPCLTHLTCVICLKRMWYVVYVWCRKHISDMPDMPEVPDDPDTQQFKFGQPTLYLLPYSVRCAFPGPADVPALCVHAESTRGYPLVRLSTLPRLPVLSMVCLCPDVWKMENSWLPTYTTFSTKAHS